MAVTREIAQREMAGEKYLAWLKANKLPDTRARFVAFIAGWTIGFSSATNSPNK